MSTPRKTPDLAQCLRLIEEKASEEIHLPDNSQDWSTQDFEQLGEEITQHTGTRLSITTLKRIWGRVSYRSAPTLTTLNALATFIGYDNWRDFQHSLASESNNSVPTKAPAEPQRTSPVQIPADMTLEHRFLHRRQWIIVIGLMLGISAVVLLFQDLSSPSPTSSANFSFSSQTVTKGLPNSVIFHYDASQALPTDSVFIQQSWDASRRQQVDRTGHEHSAIYYYPGYYRAKLVVNQQVVREHDLIIPSNGWIAAVHQEPVPIYFQPNEVIRDGVLHLPVSAIRQQSIAVKPKATTVDYVNVLPETGLMNDNFVFETRIKSAPAQGTVVCQHVQVTLLCRNDMISFPLCAKGCVGQLELYLAGKNVVSTNTDLSGFGCDLDEWVNVQCKIEQKQVSLWVDGKKAYETTFPHEPTEIIGIHYQFEGTGTVDFVRLSHLNGEKVWEDDFNSSITSVP